MSESTYEFKEHCAPQLVPSSAFNQNLRAIMSATQWKKFRQLVFAKHGLRCQFCNAMPKSLDCHEIWRYKIDTDIAIQELTAVYPLCKRCHQVCHIGFWQLQGPVDHIIAHMAKVRKISLQQAKKEIADAFVLHNHLSSFEWSLDISAADSYINP